MAAYISKDGLLCHGTFLLDADLEEARRLTEPAASAGEKIHRSRSDRMANTGIEQLHLSSLEGGGRREDRERN